jgi:predicted MFS family arabinose efflux permease
LLILSVSGFAGSFSSRVVDPMVLVMARDFSAPPPTVALLSAAFAIPYAFAQPFLGPIGDAIGKGRVMSMCLSLLLIALVAAAVAPDLSSLFVARAVAGAAAGGAVPLSLALIGDRVPVADRRLALSRYMAAVIAGQLGGSSVSGLLAELIGWRGVFALCGCLMMLALTATMMGFGRTEPGRPFRLSGALASYRAILTNPRALQLFALVFLEGATFFGMFPYLAPIVSAGGGSAADTGLAIAGFAAGGLVFSLVISRALRLLGPGRMLVIGGVVAAMAFTLMSMTSDWRALGPVLLLLGLGYNVLHNAFQARATELAPATRASAIALFVFFFFCGQGVGVFMMGAALHTLGLTMSLGIAGVLALAIGCFAAKVLAHST